MKLILYIALLASLLLCGCEHDDKETSPSVETISIKMAGGASFDVTGMVKEVGSPEVLDYGFVCSSYGSEVTVEKGTKLSLGKAPSAGVVVTKRMSVPISEYSYSYTYVRMYLTNVKGTVYGDIVEFHQSSPQITSFSPKYGLPGDQIKIYGKNFSPTSDNVVKFGGTTATIIDAKEDVLTVVLPSYTSSGAVSISVKVGSLQASTDYWTNFTLLPIITDYSPKSGSMGSTVTITGSGLNNYVGYFYFDNLTASTSSASTNQINLTVPNNLTTSTPMLKYKYEDYVKEIGTYTILPSVVRSVTPSTGFAGITKVSIAVDNSVPYSYYSTSSKIKVGSVTLSTTSDNSVIIPKSVGAGIHTISYFNGIVWSSQNVAFTAIAPEANLLSFTTNATSTQVTLTGNFFNDFKNNSRYGYLKYNNNQTYISSIVVDNTSVAPKQKITLDIPKLSAGSYNLEFIVNNYDGGDIKVTIPEPLVIP